MTAEWIMTDGHHIDELGFLPFIVTADDERPVRDQLHDRYAHGGGYMPFGQGWILTGQDTPGSARLQYPGDPLFREVARLDAPSGELVIFFQPAQLLVIAQPGDEGFVVTRVD